jgi:hypothetical protein
LQQLQNVGVTISTKKYVLTAPDVTIVGHKCTFGGCIPHKKKVQKIRNWAECQNLTQVCGFLDVYVVLQVLIKSVALIAHPLVDLTQMTVPFKGGGTPTNSYVVSEGQDLSSSCASLPVLQIWM